MVRESPLARDARVAHPVLGAAVGDLARRARPVATEPAGGYAFRFRPLVPGPSMFGPPPARATAGPEPPPKKKREARPAAAPESSPPGVASSPPGVASSPPGVAPSPTGTAPPPPGVASSPPGVAPSPTGTAPPPETARPEPPAVAMPEASDGASREAPKPGGGYEVLALRYRPQTFDDLGGQDAIARTLQNAIRKERIGNAFLFAGPRGVGKTTTARVLAKALNCSAVAGPNPDPCGSCPSCCEIAAGCSRDVPEIDGASNNSVEKAREIIETAHYTPARDRFRIFLVDEVHMLSQGAFNALLKTLEEPPAHVKFIFATTEIHKIPDTILSRCQEFEFRAVAHRAVLGRLQQVATEQGFEIGDDALSQIARFGQGSLRDSISALDQVVAAVDGPVRASDVSEVLGIPDVAICRRAARAIFEADRRAVFEVVEELIAGGRDPKQFVLLLMHYLRDIAVVRAAPDAPDLLEWPGERETLAGFAERFGEEDLLQSLDVLVRAEEGLRWSPEPRFHLEMSLLKLVELPRLARFEELLESLEKPGAAAPAPRAAAAAKPASRRDAPPPGSRPASSAAEPDPVPPVVQKYQKIFGGEVVPLERASRQPPPRDGGGSPD